MRSAVAALLLLLAGCAGAFGPNSCNGAPPDCAAAAAAAEQVMPPERTERGLLTTDVRFIRPNDPEPCEAYGVCGGSFHAIAVVQLTYPGPQGPETWSVTVVQEEAGEPFEAFRH